LRLGEKAHVALDALGISKAAAARVATAEAAALEARPGLLRALL
jgi:hypothetical protein